MAERDAHRCAPQCLLRAGKINRVMPKTPIEFVDNFVQAVTVPVFAEQRGRVAAPLHQCEQSHRHQQRSGSRPWPAVPQPFQHLNESHRVPTGIESKLLTPAGLVHVAEPQRYPACHVAAIPQPHGGLLQQAVQDGEGIPFVAQLRRQDVLMANAGFAGRRLVDRVAAQLGVHALAFDAVPGLAQHGFVGAAELLHGANAKLEQARLHGRTDAREVAWLEPIETLGQVGQVDDHETVRLLHISGGLGEKDVGRDADGATHFRANCRGDAALDLLPQCDGLFPLALAARQFTGHLVDRVHLRNGRTGFHHFNQAMVKLHIGFGPRVHQPDVRAELFCLAHQRARPDTEFLGFVARSDAAGGIGHNRHHAHGLAAQLRPQLLLDGGEIRVEIDVQEMQRHGRATDRTIVRL